MATYKQKNRGEIEAEILEIPPDVVFPMELSRVLKDKLAASMDENWQLKKQIQFQQIELDQLEKYKNESDESKEFAQPILASKIVELSRRNREMTAKIESMKTKMQKLIDENSEMKDKIHEFDNCSVRREASEVTIASAQRTEEGILSSTQELTLANSKMMQYRRQCQQLRMELRSALRALAQEVGDGATPQTVLNTVNNGTPSTWRGRQQQIMSLNQKLSDAQLRIMQLKNATQPQIQQHQVGPGGEGGSCSEYDQQFADESLESYINAIESKKSASQIILPPNRHIIGLQQQERKKHENLDKVTQELETARTELKSLQLDMKASKARAQTLESQVKAYRLQVDDLQSKLGQKQREFDSTMSEFIVFKRDFKMLQDREKNLREQTSTELHDCQQSLTRERSVVLRLQNVVSKKQENLDRLEEEVTRLQSNLDSCCASGPAVQGRESESRIVTLEHQLDMAAEAIEELEKERQRLIEGMTESATRAEGERTRHGITQRHLEKSFEVLRQADCCINDCLDAAQVINKNILKEVESLRTLMRELKTGTLFSLETVQTDDVRKLKSYINLLVKEIAILQDHLKRAAQDRRLDIKTFSLLGDKMRNELFVVFQKTVNSFRVRNF